MPYFRNHAYYIFTTSGTNSTYQDLTGQGYELMMRSTSTGVPFFFKVGSMTVTSTNGFLVGGDSDFIVPMNHSTCLAILSGGTSGYVYVLELH